MTQSNGTTITCTIIYADFPVVPMTPIINCTADGITYYTGPATKTTITPYLYDATTVIKIGNSAAPTYDCRVTFTAPASNNTIYQTYLATNTPNFTANITGERRRVIKILLQGLMTY